jgi:hypothetical protein
MIGYTKYDHPGWVETSIGIARRQDEAERERRRASGKPVREARAPTKGHLSAPIPLPAWTRRAMHVLGMTFGGIYNAPIAWDSVDWGQGRHLHVPVNRAMATFDHYELTAFVFLCHAAGIRGQIAPHHPKYLRLSMWPRETRTGSTFDRHPTLAEAVDAFWTALGTNHPVCLEHRPPERVCSVCGIDLDMDTFCDADIGETCPGGHQ